ncbi:hypothetical protein ACSQ67_006097 [Phaseolus vulgaris]
MQMNSPVFRHQVSSLMDVGGASSLPDFNVDDAMTFYASSTRYTNHHNCSHDYKITGREAIVRENPL